MKILRKTRELREALEPLRKKKKSIGFVPTMGYLHDGHLSLLKRSQKENRVSVVSIFVNPLQFGPSEDFVRYPRNLERDKDLLKKAKADYLFLPELRDFYKPGFQTRVSVHRLSRPLCGRTRPRHFDGVATVVLKLLNLVRPDALYMGQKDYQQFRVVEQMVRDVDDPVRVVLAPIVREADGLAMSSRNALLSRKERREAAVLCRALDEAARLLEAGTKDPERVKRKLREVLREAPGARVDYAEIVDARDLAPVVKLKKGMRLLVALAVFFGKTRLIDNKLIKI